MNGILAVALLPHLLGAAAPPATDARLAGRIEAAWRVQQRWEGIAKGGSFEYDFELRTWNSSGRLKEQLERTARVESRGGISRTEILASRRDGREDLEAARKEQRDLESKRSGRPRKESDFQSPFDPADRGAYAFSEASPGAMAFHPRGRLDGAISGSVEFDAEGRPRKVVFTLAHPPIFTRNLNFTISLDEEGNPARVESSGEVSLIVWKRKFESTLVVRNVKPPEATPAQR